MIKSGDLAILLNSAGKRYLKKIIKDDEMHSSDGVIDMNDVLAAGFGACRWLCGRSRTRLPDLPDGNLGQFLLATVDQVD